MKLVDELYELYRGRLQGTEEDLDMITLSVLEHLSRKELLDIIHDLPDPELEYFFRLYLFEELKEKFAQEDEQLLKGKHNFH
ncbi:MULTISPECIES: DUF6154 family protein [Bacillus]|jgi:hypothetical protein|uniref:Uncharacterized protein n=1 Tax=Bacillus smithii 7_3_47FAA TaxID=665952 RepID=G9QHN5_9BACI|nr:DUF6154 family protein [Bacillus smithii]EHL79353.1 hypothetical protein HMPREF1015_03094 [Bacillus smithii 7_3_47FAA]MED1418635.1 DUF6154 family protein [Bacillus smithii]MED1454725.1 DUF6154 family protein [Bacillus smithii]MED1488703.1 DUF6154 family protein [Bacillus smithii]MED4884962.1 DUF6154 family protein [Bacillus smithii]